MLEILKENGADVDAVTKMNDSCLHLAVTRCDVQMISKLISMGANVNSANKLGDSVLQSACSQTLSTCLCSIPGNLCSPQKRRPFSSG